MQTDDVLNGLVERAQLLRVSFHTLEFHVISELIEVVSAQVVKPLGQTNVRHSGQ